MNQTPTLAYDFGHFEGFNFRTQSAIERLLTAPEMVAWDHDRDGEAEFWPAGNTPEFSIVFDGRNTVSARELLDLSALLDGLGGLEEQHEAGEALGQRVVDLPGQPGPLGVDPGGPFGGGQLGSGGPELGDQALALSALLDDPVDPPGEEHRTDHDRRRPWL